MVAEIDKETEGHTRRGREWLGAARDCRKVAFNMDLLLSNVLKSSLEVITIGHSVTAF